LSAYLNNPGLPLERDIGTPLDITFRDQSLNDCKQAAKYYLQKDLEGEWIDGVKFLYNNDDVEFHHVGDLFRNIYYRKSK